MKRIFVIGGMGAGKSVVVSALAQMGAITVDLDALGHEVLKDGQVRQELARRFGPDVLDAFGQVNRPALAQAAFATPEDTAALNAITHPRILAAFLVRAAEIDAADAPALVVECSAFSNRAGIEDYGPDYLVAVEAPEEERVARAVAKGWSEADVRARIARQLTDCQRRTEADVVFQNIGTPQDIAQAVQDWWHNR